MHQGHRTSPRRMHKTTVIWTKFSAANTRYTLVLWQHNSKIHVTTEATVTRNSSFQNTRNTTTIISTSSFHTATGLARELLPLDQFTHLSDKYMEALASFEFCYLFYLTCRIHIMYGTILNALDRVSIFFPSLSTEPKQLHKSSRVFDLFSYHKPAVGKTSILLL